MSAITCLVSWLAISRHLVTSWVGIGCELADYMSPISD